MGESPSAGGECVEQGVTEAVATMRSATARIESLAVTEGEFCVACRETGICPAPVTDRRFESYEHAERACAAAQAYREALEELDPTLSEYDLLASTVGERSLQCATAREVVDHQRRNGLPRAESNVTLAGDGYDEWLRIENAPVVHLSGPESLLDDELVTRQLDSKL
jgi:hypothetical protein